MEGGTSPSSKRGAIVSQTLLHKVVVVLQQPRNVSEPAANVRAASRLACPGPPLRSTYLMGVLLVRRQRPIKARE